MQKAQKQGIIVAKNGAEVDSALRKMGYEPQTVYFKRDPKAFFKYEGETKGLFENNLLHEEYSRLCALYAADPVHIVRPIAEVKDGAGNGASLVGFVMEEVQGVVLGALDYESYYSKKSKAQMRRNRVKFISSLEELIHTVNGLHEKGLYHGDLNYFNIIVGNKGGVKLIDPYVMDPADAVMDDLIRLYGYQKKIDHLKSLLRE